MFHVSLITLSDTWKSSQLLLFVITAALVVHNFLNKLNELNVLMLCKLILL